MFGKKKKDKKKNPVKETIKYRLYGVLPAKYLDKNGKLSEKASLSGRFLTLSDKEDDCLEYIYIKEVQEHAEHFYLWCESRKLDPMDTSNWKAYRDITLGNTCDYRIIPFDISWEDLLAMIRMFQCCKPIGCSYERTLEVMYYNDRLKKSKSNVDDMEKETEKPTEKDDEIDWSKVPQ